MIRASGEGKFSVEGQTLWPGRVPLRASVPVRGQLCGLEKACVKRNEIRGWQQAEQTD